MVSIMNSVESCLEYKFFQKCKEYAQENLICPMKYLKIFNLYQHLKQTQMVFCLQDKLTSARPGDRTKGSTKPWMLYAHTHSLER